MKQVVILNGAPNSGKDTIADVLADTYGWAHVRFKDILYRETAEYFHIALDTMIRLCTDRDLKEKKTSLLNGYSPRGALIHVSEEVIKPAQGPAYFGEVLSKRLTDAPWPGPVVISDGGFYEELIPMCDDHEVCLIGLFREGCTFDGDSRDYLSLRDGDVHNNGTVDDAVCAVLKICENTWMGGLPE